MKVIKWFIKSNHFWMWLVYIIGLIAYRCYNAYLIEQNTLFASLDTIELYFLFIGCNGIWLLFYSMIIFSSDIEDL